MVAKRCCRFFRVRVNENDDEDRHCVMVEMMIGMMVRENMKNKTSIAGWGVVPRMAPPPSQGGST